MKRLGKTGGTGWTLALVLVLAWWTMPATGQVPALPDTKAIGDAIGKAAGKEDAGTAPAPTKDNPEATVSEAAGPIAVESTVDDEQVEARLNELLPEFPGVVTIQAQVRNGVVKLTGHVENDEVRDRLRDFVRRVEGVNLVINQTRTDAQVLTARQRALKKIDEYREVISRTWLLALFALAVLVGSVLLARAFNAYSETLLAPLSGNMLLRSVLGSIIGAAIVAAGVFASLSVLGLTEVVLSVLGLAGVAALAVGFAFRDITENFIASVLLGVRRPFRVGDYVEVAGKAGVVRSLNTRATVLVTLEGNHIRIPNSIMFKEVLVNKTASASVRGTFDVLIPYEASTTAAQEAIGRALRGHEAILPDPPARTLVEELEPAGVRLRSYFWSPARGIDGFKLMSDVKLLAKVALQQAGIAPPPTGVTVAFAGRLPIDVSRPAGHDGDGRGQGRAEPARGVVFRPGATVTAAEARANLQEDRRAAEAAADRPESHDKAREHVMSAAESCVSDEGENLIARGDEP